MSVAHPPAVLFPDLQLPLEEQQDAPEAWQADAAEDAKPAFVPLFSQAQRPPPGAALSAMLAEARDQAFNEGVAAGRDAETASREALVAASLSHIADTVADTVADAVADAAQAAHAVAEEAAAEMALLVADILALALPGLAESMAGQDAAAFAAGLVPALTAEPHIDIRVAPALAPGLAERLASEPAAHVVADPDLPQGDVRIGWRDGRAEHRGAAFRSAMLGMVADLLASAGGQQAAPTGTEQ